MMALDFYGEYATPFVQDFGLMPGFIDRLLKLPEAARRVFLAKLSKIHETILRMRDEKMRQGMK